MIERISQSFIKSMRSYNAGDECGNVVKHIYVDGLPFERHSDAMAEGSYFEFCLTGAIPKNGQIPRPIYMTLALNKKSTAQLGVNDMTQDYRRAHFNARKVNSTLSQMGLKIVGVQKKLIKGRFDGTLDIIAECVDEIKGLPWKKGQKIVIDIKYSGLLYDKWEKHGWMWSNIQKEYHGTQARQYHFVSGLPFYFLVISNTNKEINTGSGVFEDPDMKLFHVLVDEHMIETHLAEGNTLMDQLKFEAEVGFEARPSLKICSKCPLKDGCIDKHIFPHVEEVDLTIF